MTRACACARSCGLVMYSISSTIFREEGEKWKATKKPHPPRCGPKTILTASVRPSVSRSVFRVSSTEQLGVARYVTNAQKQGAGQAESTEARDATMFQECGRFSAKRFHYKLFF